MNNDDTFIPNSGELSPELEARVVAWVLGEASAFEAAQLEALCAERPELAVFKRRIEAVHGLLGEEARPVKTPLRLSPERRAKVLAVIGGDAPRGGPVVPALAKARRKARSWRSWALPMAACFTLMTLLAAVMIPTVGSVRKSAQKPKRPDPSATVLGPSVESSSFGLSSHEPEGRVEHRVRMDQLAAGSSGLMSEQPMDVAQWTAAPKPDGFSPALPSLRYPQSYGEVSSTVEATPEFAAAAPIVYYDRGTGLSDAQDKYIGSVSGVGGGAGMDFFAPPPPPSAPAPVAAPAKSRSSITITAGTPQTFTVRAFTESEKQEVQRKLGDQRLALAADRDMADAKGNGFLVDDGSQRRLDSAVAEVRRRREFRSDSSSDPFAAPASGASGDFANAAEFKKQDELLVAKGRSQYLAGDLDGAKDTFRTLESVAPENAEAHAFLGRIAKEKSAVDGFNRAKSRGQLLEEVSNSWQRPGVLASSAPRSASLQDKLHRIVIPQAHFSGVPLSRVIASLTAVSEEYDRSGEDSPGANILLLDPSGNDPQVSITLRNLSLGRILDLITESTGYRYEIQDNAVVVRPDNDAPAPRKPGPQAIDEALRAEIPAATEAVSTFSLHVSDASFRLAKAALERGQAPEAATIRPEEFYNAFDYGDPAPGAGEAVSCRVEQAAHPFLQQRNLVRIAMKVPAAGRGAGQPLRLTVLLDTSGSMEREDRAATVRAALTALTSLLGPEDRVTLIGFARTPRLLAESVTGDQAAKLVELAARTPAEGGTNMKEALALAGELAARHKLAAAQNRIVLLTDGAANLGDADPEALATRVEGFRQNGIAFDACGVVADGLDDAVLEALTRKGDGRYAVLNSPEEADAGFARRLAGAFRPAAKDVKVQVHFNPARVARYRLIGFEKHRLKTEDFRNDAVDAAELAAEEAAVALYQVEVLPEGEGELGEVAVRFLDTRSNERVERSWTLAYAAQPAAFARATPSLQLAGAAAFLAEKLRGGALAGQVRLEEFAPVVEGLGAAYPQAERVREFITMFRQARRLTGE